MGKCIVLRHPDSRLRQKSRPVIAFDGYLQRLVRDLADTMTAANGAGLAAIQIGDPWRVVVIANDVYRENPQAMMSIDEKTKSLVLVNPEITWRADEVNVTNEGCLSFPGMVMQVPRNAAVKVAAQNLAGETVELETHDPWFARALQHEIDHLDGRMLVDLALTRPV